MIIRSVTAADRAAFLAMMEEFYASDAVLHPLPRETMERCFDDCIARGPYAEGWLMEEAGHSVGFATIGRGYSTEAGGECIYLEDLYIRPAYRGKGIGQAFFKTLLQAHPSARRFRLEAEPGNASAIGLYERLGFQKLPYTQMILDLPGGQES